MRAPVDWKKRGVLETCFIKMKNPNLNDQKDIRNLLLFRNGVT